VELLVVIAIIGVLVALLLPAVQAAREAANRMSCGNNLKQLGIAFHNYHDTHKKLPYSSTYAVFGPKHTWVELIMPFVEQQPTHDKIEFAVNNDHNVDTNGDGITNLSLIQNVAYPFVSCPSNGLTDQYFPTGGTVWSESVATQGLDYPLAAGSIYADGVTPDCATLDSFCMTENASERTWGETDANNGPGPFNRGVTKHKFATMTDGLSNTIFAGDRRAQECNWGGAFDWNFTVAFSGQRPNSKTRNKTTPSDYRRNCGYSSFHPGGVNVVLGDGSVRFVGDTIDFPTWCYLNDKADGQPVQVP
jgi:prepilin-type processing-associated H-X9-DG protein